MMKAEFIEAVENGSDILFDVLGHHLCIFTWLHDGIGIGVQNDDKPLTVFSSADELLSHYKVNGFPLEAIVNDITITDYS